MPFGWQSWDFPKLERRPARGGSKRNKSRAKAARMSRKANRR